MEAGLGGWGGGGRRMGLLRSTYLKVFCSDIKSVFHYSYNHDYKSLWYSTSICLCSIVKLNAV